MKRLVPYPLFACFIFVMWLLITNVAAGQIIVAAVVALITNHIMSFLDPERIHIKSWSSWIKLIYYVVIDITVSNFKVAKLILLGKDQTYSGFTIVALDLKGPTALAILSCIMTMTPGTVWVSYNSKTNELLLHVLNLLEEDNLQQQIKNRYERILLEILQ